MRKFLPVLVTVLLLGAGFLGWQNIQLHQQNTDVRAKHDAAEKSYSEALGAIAEIQDSLSAIGVREAQQPVLPGTPAAERGLSMARGREALDRIAMLKAGLSQTRERIANLEEKLKRSGVHVASLEHMIVNLKRDVADRESRIAELSAQVDSLHVQVDGLNATVAANEERIRESEQRIESQRQEIGTVYVAMGDKHSLTENGLVKPVGGFLGLGRTLQVTGKDTDPLYASLDTDDTTVIHIPSARARVLSAQPATSYTLEPAGKELELKILDANAFRSVRRVVILTS
jgi:hypothetical protein